MAVRPSVLLFALCVLPLFVPATSFLVLKGAIGCAALQSVLLFTFCVLPEIFSNLKADS